MATETPFQKLKVLLVEDQPEARSMTRNMLSELGITQIFESKDGREALSFMDMADDFVNFVICDWNMPNLSGIELLKQIRSVNGALPFLLVTGRTDMDSVFEAKSAGVSGYIRKPFSPAQLEAKLRALLHKTAA
jgi:two-component system chemotaxis response regulator CheY